MRRRNASTSASWRSRAATRPRATRLTGRKPAEGLAGNATGSAKIWRMAETTEAPLWHENEPAKVESWRLHILLEAGYPVPLAERIAVSEVDLHDAVLLFPRGCAPVTATEILL